jgi:hypothetical protein
MKNATRQALQAAQASALINAYCDRAEHNETVERDWVLDAGRTFRLLGLELAQDLSCDPFGLYARRLVAIEKRNVLYAGEDLGQSIREAKTWRELQLVQVEHDRLFHPDVFGMSRADQLRHYAFHAAKLAGVLAGQAQGAPPAADVFEGRIADLLLFGVKLATVMFDKLPETSRHETA